MPTIENYRSEKVELRAARIGKGLFATAPIAKGEIVVIWGGRIIPTEAIDDDFSLQISDDFFLCCMDPAAEKDDAEYVNHSCDPSCGVRGQIVLEAMRDIAPGEEITYDYAMTDTKTAPFDCRCGSPRCRQRISAQDWTLADLQERYRGFFSDYIERKIRARQAG